MLAPCPPVVKPNDAPTGKPSRSFSQPPAMSSTTAAPGEVNALNAGWSHPTVRMSAACRGVEGATDDEPEVAGTGRGD